MRVLLTESDIDLIVSEYLRTYSISEMLRNSKLPIGIGRGRLQDVLKSRGVYEGLNGPNFLKAKVAKHEALMMSKHGVTNWGQTGNGGWKSLNAIPYSKPIVLGELYAEYVCAVEKRTKTIVHELKRAGKIPTKCFYTGIEFADVSRKPNPNDPFKRSVDHKVPTLLNYLENVSPDIAGGRDNLVFVLRYVNHVKSSTTHESFLPIAKLLTPILLSNAN